MYFHKYAMKVCSFLATVAVLIVAVGCGNNTKATVAVKTISVKSEQIVDDYIRDVGTAEKKYKNMNVAITGQVYSKGQYNNSQDFFIVTGYKAVGGKHYEVELVYPVKRVDEVNKLKQGDFVAAEGACVGMVPQKDPTSVSIQINVGEKATGMQATEQATATATTASASIPAKDGKVMTLSPEQQKNMDVFFSNFAEVWGNPPQGGKVAFDYDGISNRDLITFGVYHNLINRQTVVQLVNGKYMVSLKEVNFATNKYLGKTVAPEAVDTRFTTDGDNFYSRENGGPAFWSAAKLKQMYDNGDGTFSADVYVYASSDRNNDYSNGKLWKAVLAVSPSDSSRYILKSWKRGW